MGFTQSVSNGDYIYSKDGEYFIILGKEKSQKVMNESAMVYIIHYIKPSSTPTPEDIEEKSVSTKYPMLSNYSEVPNFFEIFGINAVDIKEPYAINKSGIFPNGNAHYYETYSSYKGDIENLMKRVNAKYSLQLADYDLEPTIVIETILLECGFVRDTDTETRTGVSGIYKNANGYRVSLGFKIDKSFSMAVGKGY